MCIANVSLPLGLVALIKTTCTTHVNLAAADAVVHTAVSGVLCLRIPGVEWSLNHGYNTQVIDM